MTVARAGITGATLARRARRARAHYAGEPMDGVWSNWAGDQRCAPAVVEHPASEAEVVECIGRAVDSGRRVRVAGSGHSFSDAACTDGHMLRLDRMSRVLDADPGTGLARV